MGDDLRYLIDRPVLLILVLFVGAMIGIGIEKFDRWQKRQKWQKRQGKHGKVTPFQPKADLVPQKIPGAADQLRTVMRADFRAQPLLNKSEARVFKALDKMVIEMRPGWQVMAQVSLGEILRCEDKDAYAVHRRWIRWAPVAATEIAGLIGETQALRKCPGLALGNPNVRFLPSMRRRGVARCKVAQHARTE